VELEALIKQQDQTLRAQGTAQIRPSHFEDRRQSISSVHSLPPIQKTPPTEYNYVSSCSHPGRVSRHNSTGRHDVTGLDHLADVAATSPPAADRRSPVSNPDIDPDLGYTAVSFPSFPHDIFTSHSQLVATPSRETEIQSPIVDESIGALLPFGSESEGLPPKEILDIMIDLFFQYIHPSFPILHKATFLSSLLLPAALRPQTTIILRALVIITSSYAHLSSRLEVYPLFLELKLATRRFSQYIIFIRYNLPSKNY
jgi:hypothetical protein